MSKKEIGILTSREIIQGFFNYIFAEMGKVLIPQKGYCHKSDVFLHYYPDLEAQIVNVLDFHTDILYRFYVNPEGDDMVTLNMCIYDREKVRNVSRNCLVDIQTYGKVVSGAGNGIIIAADTDGKIKWITFEDNNYRMLVKFIIDLQSNGKLVVSQDRNKKGKLLDISGAVNGVKGVLSAIRAK